MLPSAVRRVAGVRELSSNYDTLLLDQFGVLHDGRRAYPHALEATRRLAEAGKRLIVLSNSGRRAAETLAKLEQLGFCGAWFSGAVTSGETTHAALMARCDPLFARLGRRCLHFDWAERGAVGLDPALGLVAVQRVEEAEFLLAHGVETCSGQAVSLQGVKELLEQAARQALPLIIANPDVVTVDTTALVPMPGQLGLWYSAMAGAGEVVLMGKPSQCIYDAALAMGHPGRTLAVGDSLAHDIMGALGAGVDSLFISSGIHAGDLSPNSSAALERLASEHCSGGLPTFVAEHFEW